MGGATSLGATLDPSYHLNETVNVWRAAWAIGLGCISIVFGLFTLWMLLGRPWRPTLMFIIVLVLSDWFKAVWQLVFSSYWLVWRPVGGLQHAAWCQAQGFFYAWSIEMSDFTLTAMLFYVVLGVAFRKHSASRWFRFAADTGYCLWFVLPLLLAGLGFVGGNRYTNQGTTCYLPVRPFWYRLGLSWVPRYAMLAVSSSAVIWLLLYIKAKHRSFLILLKRPESTTSQQHLHDGTFQSTQLTLPRREDVIPGADFGELPASYKGRISPTMPELNTNNLIEDEKANTFSKSGTADTFAEESLNSSSEELLRRLRRLWVYPSIYFLYWIFPFVYHATSYEMIYVDHPISWLAGFSSSFVALHCTFMSAAVWIFERPDMTVERGATTVWQHMLNCLRWAVSGDCFGREVRQDQRRSNNLAQQRLAIEIEELRNRTIVRFPPPDEYGHNRKRGYSVT